MINQRRAGVLPLVLVLTCLCAGLCLLVMERHIVRIRYTRQLEETMEAEHLAESGIAAVIARVKHERSWLPADGVLRATIPQPSDAKAGFVVRFGPEASINNSKGDTPLPLEKPICPQGCVYVVSVGSCNGYLATVTALVASPPYPYSIASSGTIRSRDGMVMGAVPPGFDPASGVLDLKKLGKAEMMTQGQDDGEGAALWLRGKNTIVGTARSRGSIEVTLDDEASAPEELEGVSEEVVPKIPLAELTKAGDIQTLPRAEFSELEKLSGQLQYSGESLHFARGVQLNGATLRVKGNLVIDGPVTGIGALIVEGDVTLRGGAGLSADNQCAIVSTGSVSVKGSGQGSYFQGLIYAEGSRGISLSDCTVVGTVLNAGEVSPGVGAPMQVERATVAFQSQSVSQTVDLSATGVDDGNAARSARLKKPLPLSSFYDEDRGWQIPSNVRSSPDAANPLGLSPLELALLPCLELRINGKWYASAEEALAAGASQASVRTAIGIAGLAYNRALQAAKDKPPAENSSLSFKLDLNKYLQTAGRLRVVKLGRL
ncbi:hypothetical protein ABS71_05445 [bacterium SCN 62-11]|nr:MAG: hypothetical protein ABS71_05445 [bacterium SCN 62-11]